MGSDWKSMVLVALQKGMGEINVVNIVNAIESNRRIYGFVPCWRVCFLSTV